MTANAGDIVSANLPLPDAPPIFRDLFLQLTYLNPGVGGRAGDARLQLSIR